MATNNETMDEKNQNKKTTEGEPSSNQKVKKENKNPVTNKIIDTAKIVAPIIDRYDPKVAAIVRTTVKTKEHNDKPTINGKAVAADLITAAVPFTYPYSKKGAITLIVTAKGLKAASEYNPADKINTILQVGNVITPIVSVINPPAAATMEVTINLAKLHHNSKLTLTNQELYSDLATAFIPAVKLVNKKTGVAMEVFLNAYKTETGAEAIQLLKLQVLNALMPSNNNKQPEIDKNCEKLQDAANNQMPRETTPIDPLVESFIQEFCKIWALEGNSKNNQPENNWSELEIIYGAIWKAAEISVKMDMAWEEARLEILWEEVGLDMLWKEAEVSVKMDMAWEEVAHGLNMSGLDYSTQQNEDCTTVAMLGLA